MTDVLTLDPHAYVRRTVRPTAPSFPTLVGIEARTSVSARSGKALVAAAALFGPAAMTLALTTGDDVGPVGGPIGVVGMLTGLILLSFGVLSTAGEWSHRTVQTTFLLVPHRGRVLAAKAAAVALMGMALAAVSAGLAAGVLVVTGGDGLVWEGVGQALLAAIGAGAAFAVIGAGVGAALANTPAALTSLYLVILGVLPVVRTVKPEVGARLDPAEAVLALAQGQSETRSVLILAGWVVLASVAGWILTHRRAVQ
jgi:ABC-2 type transport system permease protein